MQKAGGAKLPLFSWKRESYSVYPHFSVSGLAVSVKESDV